MSLKLLIADDSLTIQKVIKLALSNDGYEIHAVSDGTNALEQMALFMPDVVLMDIAIPGKSAFELKQALNQDPELNSIPVILMCSAFEKVDEAKVALLGFQGRLTKPFDPTHLRQALQRAIDAAGGKKELGQDIPTAPSEMTQEMSYPPPIFGKLSARDDDDETGDIPIHQTERQSVQLTAEADIDEPLENYQPQTTEIDDVQLLVESTVNQSGLYLEEPKIEIDDIPAFEGWGIEEPLKSGLISNPKAKPEPKPQVSTSQSPSRSQPPMVTDLSFESPEFDKAELQALIQKQVEEKISDLAKRAIPDIAEKVIKNEIRKLLESLR